MNTVSQSLCESTAAMWMQFLSLFASVDVISSAHKGGTFICKYPNYRCGAYSRAALIKLFSVKVQHLFESGAYSSSST